MADQAYKVYDLFEYRIHAVLETHNRGKILILTRRLHYSRLRPVGGAKTLPPSVFLWGPMDPGVDRTAARCWKCCDQTRRWLGEKLPREIGDFLH